jgi:cell division ATPase FtsA
MNVEAKAVVDCFTHIYRRKTDADLTTCFVDMGSSGTRVMIAKSGQILFARSIPIGGEHFNRAVANGLKISLEDARVLRIKLCAMQAQAAQAAQAAAEEARQAGQAPAPATFRQPQAEPQSLEQAFPLLGAAMAASSGKSSTSTAAAPRTARHEAAAPAPAFEGGGELQEKSRLVEQALREPLNKLTEELDLCRRYHETTFHSKPLDRLVFIGGEARHRGLCMHIARSLSLAAQVGDPLVRMGRTSDVGVESGIDRRQPQPSWSVAIGLSMGPVAGVEKPAGKAGKSESKK